MCDSHLVVEGLAMELCQDRMQHDVGAVEEEVRRTCLRMGR